MQRLGCASCHASPGGSLAGQSEPRPGTSAFGSNLTPDDATGLGAWSDDAIVGAMRDGVDDEGAPLCPTMPRFVLSDADARAIVAYLRSLPAETNEVPESTCGPGEPPPEPTPPDDLDAGKGSVECTLVAPSQSATCHACGDAHPCQHNGCYGGWWCDERQRRCVPRPEDCVEPG